MNEDKQALIDGIATGLAFVGIMGFAVNSSVWPVLISLIVTAVALPIVSRRNVKR
jgi:hypothetical protein